MDLITIFGQFLLLVTFIFFVGLLAVSPVGCLSCWREFEKFEEAMCPSFQPLTVRPSAVNQISMRKPHISSPCSATSSGVIRPVPVSLVSPRTSTEPVSRGPGQLEVCSRLRRSQHLPLTLSRPNLRWKKLISEGRKFR